MSPGEPIHLMVRDAPAPAAPILPAWAPVSIIAAALLALAAAGYALRRRLARPRDPYDRLLDRVAGLVQLSDRERSALMMACGGEPRRALGALLTGATPRKIRARRRRR